MTIELIESLLNEDESTALDFKRDQYKFTGAGEDEKGELLKDILAFANAWTSADAYILIGVEEVRGGRSRVVGVQEHLDDAKLQQFVNTKTKTPVTFSYQVFSMEGVEIGVLHIPVQQRPVHLLDDYGRLKRNVVYIRRGSSTAEASPDEIAKMGLLDGLPQSDSQPDLILQFGNPYSREIVGTQVELLCEVLEPIDADNLKPPRTRNVYDAARFARLFENRRYYEDLVAYVMKHRAFKPLGFCVQNQSSIPAKGVLLEAKIPKASSISIAKENEMPDPPRKENCTFLAQLSPEAAIARGLAARTIPSPKLKSYPDYWEVTVDFGTILPRSEVWSSGVFYIGAEEPSQIVLTTRLCGENISDPILTPLEICFNVCKREMVNGDIDMVRD